MESADAVIVDYGMGNTGSIVNIIRRIGRTAEVSSLPEVIANAQRLILPGVGAFDEAMGNLYERALIAPVLAASERGTPILGVCLGMQLLLDGSEEGQLPGLGLVPGRCRRFPTEFDSRQLLVPHMGWNTVSATEGRSPLPSLGAYGSRYYFVHSYFAEPADEGDVLGQTVYGQGFASAIGRGNVLGVQFHPEKSHRHGAALLTDFLSDELSLEGRR